MKSLWNRSFEWEIWGINVADAYIVVWLLFVVIWGPRWLLAVIAILVAILFMLNSWIVKEQTKLIKEYVDLVDNYILGQDPE